MRRTEPIELHLRFHPEVPTGGDCLSHFFGMFGAFFRLIFGPLMKFLGVM